MALENQEVKKEMPRPTKSEAIGIGAIIRNRYQVVAYLGRGGMSTVYKALDMSTGRSIALKILHAELLSDNTRVQRFMQEAKTYRNLRHDHIVKTYDFFEDDKERHCLVMEYHEGKNLSEVLTDTGRLSIRRAIKVFSEICSALDHAHAQGIVHRDLKPSNIALVETENDADYVKVLDFGIAKLMPTDDNTQLGLTQTGEIVGSPLYMSPEQCMAKPIDHRSDIYSLGCLMYEALTGEPPLMGGNVYETFHMQTHERPKPLGEVRPEYKGGTQFEFIILKAMAKHPRHRYQTMNELKDALDQVGSFDAGSGVKKLVTKYNQNKIRERAAKGKGIPAPLAAGVTAAVVIAGAFLFQDRIKQIIVPADQRYRSSIVEYRNAFDKGNYEVAEQEGLKALRVAEEERPLWLPITLNNMIDLYRIQGEIPKADALNERLSELTAVKVKNIAKKERSYYAKLKNAVLTHSEDVEQTEEFCFQLIDVSQGYIDNEQWKQAKELLEKTLVLAKKALGDRSLVVASLIDNLALLELKDNLNEKYAQLEKHLSDAVANRQEVAGLESTGLIKTLEALSEVQRRRGELGDARVNASKALTIARNAFRSTSSQAAVTKCQLAEIDLALKRPGQAESTATTALESMDRLKESDDIEQARCHILIGEANAQSDQFSDAAKEFDQARDLLKEAADSQVILLSRALSDLGDIHFQKAQESTVDATAATGYYRRALALMFRSRAREEQKVLHILKQLTKLYQDSDKSDETLKLYKMAELVDKSTGKTRGVIEDRKLIGFHYRDEHKFADAAASMEQALSLSETFHGVTSPESCALLGLLADNYLKDKKEDKAGPLLQSAVKILHSDAAPDIPRKVKVQVLSTYANYLELTNDKQNLEEIRKELNSV
ncbi:MAG: serine/threonine-protein kinase [Candidatus Melainabacteria bacterium]|nr:serine/threonine-protein kinase [Candidatus Melainabacteria bacterium]